MTHHAVAVGGTTSTDIPINSLLYPKVTWSRPDSVRTPDEVEWEAEGRSPYQCWYNFGTATRRVSFGYFWRYQSVDVYFPIGDAEAVEVATLDYAVPTLSNNQALYTDTNYVVSFHAEGDTRFGAIAYGPEDPWFCTEDAGLFGASMTSDSETPDRILESEIEVFLYSRDLAGEEGDYTAGVNTYFFRSKIAEDPGGVKFSESWNAMSRKGDFVGSLGHTDVNIGTWTGWQ